MNWNGTFISSNFRWRDDSTLFATDFGKSWCAHFIWHMKIWDIIDTLCICLMTRSVALMAPWLSYFLYLAFYLWYTVHDIFFYIWNFSVGDKFILIDFHLSACDFFLLLTSYNMVIRRLNMGHCALELKCCLFFLLRSILRILKM